MYHIIICDRDSFFVEQFYSKLKQVTQNLFIECSIIKCKEAEQVKEILLDEPVNLLFLGVELEKSQGFELGKYIREYLLDFHMQIVYVSEKVEYAMQLFETMPFDFLLKSVFEEKLKSTMERFLKVHKKEKRLFQFKKGKTMKVIPYDKIIYFQSASPRLLVYTINGTTEFYGKLEELKEQLPEYFIQIHKSYILNTRFVIGIRYNSVTLSDKHELPISRSYKEKVKGYLQ